jgi:hypothetical protein
MTEQIETKQIAYPDSNRIGKFQILHEVLFDGRERPLLQALFGLCLILDTEDHESGRGKTYIAASALFQPLIEGEEIPEYRIECAWPDQAFKNPEHENDCIGSAGFRFKAIRQIIVRVPPAQLTHRPGTPGQFH